MGLCTLLRRKLHSATTLSRHDWWILLQAWALLLAVDLALRLLPFSTVRAMWEQGRKKTSDLLPELEEEALDCRRRMTDLAARNYLHPVRCLQHALVLQGLLGRRGIQADLHIGVQEEEGRLSAHAWLEYAGLPVGARSAGLASFTLLEPGSAR